MHENADRITVGWWPDGTNRLSFFAGGTQSSTVSAVRNHHEDKEQNTTFGASKTLAALVVAASATSGCATITRGTEDVLKVRTDPPGAQVQTSNGYSCTTTPCNLRMPRRSKFVVEITKAGCRPAQLNMTQRTADAGAAGIAGNVLVGGVIGLGVDAATGASQDLVPNPVEVTLNC